MPNNATAKIKSALKYWPVLVLSAVLLLAAAGIIIQKFGSADTQQPPEQAWGEHVDLAVSGQQYELEVAATEKTQVQGLSGRASMPHDQGMIFVYGSEAVRCFWMKDMHFSIDIIWLDHNREVVHIESDVSPGTYPDSFCPDGPAQYVIELNAGEVAQAGIEPGQRLDF